MKRYSVGMLMMLFLFTFVFAMTMAVGAKDADPVPQYMCCWYTNACGDTGYGGWIGLDCVCERPIGGQGWYGGCFWACPPNCNIP